MMSTPPAAPHPPSIIPPWWSCLLMTAAVVFCVGGLAAAFIALGNPAPAAAPTQFVILTAPPQALTQIAAGLPNDLDLPQSPQRIGAASNLVLSGPTLPAVVFTPTPQPIQIGLTVVVVDVGDQQLNVRERAGIVDVPISFRTPEGTRLLVIDGPSQGDGLTWWRVQDSSGRSGWAASNYLQPLPPTP